MSGRFFLTVFFVACTLGITAAIPLPIFAQLTLQPQKPITLEVQPEQPAPGDAYSLSLTSYSIDLDRSTIIWRINGEVVAEGDGLKQISSKAGALGSTQRISVSVVSDDGSEGSVSALIRPVEIDLLWNSDSYVPPLYRGKPLAGNSSSVHVYALTRFPLGNGLLPERDIIYTWSRNSTVLSELSGRGKSRIHITGPAMRDTDVISVTAESVDREWLGRASTRIAAHDTELSLHEHHPLFGILFHRALEGEVHTTESEQKVTAIPYFANVASSQDASLEYAWSVNGIAATAPTESPDTLLITTENYTGPAIISLNLTDIHDFFLHATRSWTLVFDGAFAGMFTPTGFGQ